MFATPACLIVDDSEAVRKVMRPILEALGLKVIEAGSIAKARELCEVRLPGYVILDWHVTGEDPLAFLKDLRADASSDKLKIIYVMTTLDPADIQAAKEAGADQILGKPFVRVQLEAMMVAMMTPPAELVPEFSADRPLMRAGVPVRMPIAQRPEAGRTVLAS